ncbi:zinc finger BED domain-containing protein RICESLEEPER 2 [Tanacetum coccineum]
MLSQLLTWPLIGRDILSIQVSTVAFESAFSASARILDPYRNALAPNIVEALERMDKTTNNGSKKGTEALENNFDWFESCMPFEKGFDEFCKSWWMKNEKDGVCEGGWNSYVPHEEWKS